MSRIAKIPKPGQLESYPALSRFQVYCDPTTFEPHAPNSVWFAARLIEFANEMQKRNKPLKIFAKANPRSFEKVCQNVLSDLGEFFVDCITRGDARPLEALARQIGRNSKGCQWQPPADFVGAILHNLLFWRHPKEFLEKKFQTDLTLREIYSHYEAQYQKLGKTLAELGRDKDAPQLVTPRAIKKRLDALGVDTAKDKPGKKKR